MTNFWTRAARFPPVLVRLLARHPHGPPLTDEEISRASGIPLYQVFVISRCTNWFGIDLPTMHRFLLACRLDFENPQQMDRAEAYRRSKPTWKYLRTSPHWATLYEPLSRIFQRWTITVSKTLL